MKLLVLGGTRFLGRPWAMRTRARRRSDDLRRTADRSRRTIGDTADWLAARGNAGARKHVLAADAERALVTL